MVFVPFSRTAKVVFVYLVNNVRVQNSLHFQHIDSIDQNELATLASSMYTWWHTWLRPWLGNHLTLLRVEGIEQTSVAQNAAIFIPPTTVTGGVTSGIALPNNVSYAISFRTDARGRSGRGRNFIPGMKTGMIVGDTVNTGYKANWIAAYQKLLQGGGGAPSGWVWVIAQRKSDGEWLTTGIVRPVMFVTTADDYLDSMRKRLFRPAGGA